MSDIGQYGGGVSSQQQTPVPANKKQSQICIKRQSALKDKFTAKVKVKAKAKVKIQSHSQKIEVAKAKQN